MTFDALPALRDGAVLAGLASIVVMGALRSNPRLLMRHYPKALRDGVPPMTMAERWWGLLIGLVLIGLLTAGPIVSTARLPDGLSFGSRFAHAFIVGMVFNLVDWLLLDELWLGVLRPRWAMLPGAEHVAFRFNHLQHARGFLVGSVLALLAAALAASLTG